ncbi:MAG: SDR family oxidoreductase [Pseudomonadota bacterium]|nr:SDR family oxidoreductase [Pseudomonadota bacterium]
MSQDFSGKVVAISGAARGIGAAHVKEFLRRGANVVALDRQWDTSDAFHGDLVEEAAALPLSCDITSQEDVDSAFAATIEEWGTVDVLINNAAMRQRDFYPANGVSAVLNTEDWQWDKMFAINVTGTLKLTRAFIRPMLEKRSGSIVNISANGSVTIDEGGGVYSGSHPHLLNQPYDATKAALTSMSFYLADEVKARNVAVNIVFPGPTRTTGSDEMVEGRRKAGAPLSALLEPSHLFPVVFYLAKQTDGGVTGRAFDARKWSLW